jgi:hypothetical protein
MVIIVYDLAHLKRKVVVDGNVNIPVTLSFFVPSALRGHSSYYMRHTIVDPPRLPAHHLHHSLHT